MCLLMLCLIVFMVFLSDLIMVWFLRVFIVSEVVWVGMMIKVMMVVLLLEFLRWWFR